VDDDARARQEELARLAAGGDSKALDQLLAAIRPDVLRRCTNFLPNPLDAEEACQDTLVAVARRIGSFEGRARFSTWLYQVTTNACLDTYRRLKRRASIVGVQLPEQASHEHTSVVAGTRVDLLEALEALDPRFAEPVVLRDVFGLDYSEIARQVGIPEGTVKSRIHEGRKSLQYLLSR
jgi:RNA polymerase sigma-70 factor (ECF subfamily)